MTTRADDVVSAFIGSACAPRDSGHASGTLDSAEAILAAHPEIASSNIHSAAGVMFPSGYAEVDDLLRKYVSSGIRWRTRRAEGMMQSSDFLVHTNGAPIARIHHSTSRVHDGVCAARACVHCIGMR
jgi:hypothetical protein